VLHAVPSRALPVAGRVPELSASRPSLLCDHLRVPYRHDAGAAGRDGGLFPERHPLHDSSVLRWHGRGGATRRLLHPGASEVPGRLAEHRWGGQPFFAAVLPDAFSESWLQGTGAGWHPVEPILDRGDRRVASVWQATDGSTFLPFDPDAVIRAFWSEAYQGAGAGGVSRAARTAARRLYYGVRPALPRAAQIALRRGFTPLQARTRFPRWPLEPALHDFCDRLLALHARLAGEPVPYLAPWPRGYDWALVLTHDVETAIGLEHVHLLRDLELAAGYRSSWNLVPERYAVPHDVVRELSDAGFEIGVHGLRHDGRDIESRRRLRRRLPAMRAAAERWGASGFRAPALHRSWQSMPTMGFDYDSSYPDSDPYEPQPGGCCSWLPFFNADLVELPVTLPQDHTLFTLLGETTERLWIEKARALAARGGMALLITHPDYMLDAGPRAAYERFLAAHAGDRRAWRPLPRDVSSWWRRRAASTLEPVHGEWRVSGPAAGEAAIAFAGP
jgi:peptidoglycan/xylan/chitin deacetylase (PgdA/CDA1 family)